jgi:hypothetical protein
MAKSKAGPAGKRKAESSGPTAVKKVKVFDPAEYGQITLTRPSLQDLHDEAPNLLRLRRGDYDSDGKGIDQPTSAYVFVGDKSARVLLQVNKHSQWPHLVFLTPTNTKAGFDLYGASFQQEGTFLEVLSKVDEVKALMGPMLADFFDERKHVLLRATIAMKPRETFSVFGPSPHPMPTDMAEVLEAISESVEPGGAEFSVVAAYDIAAAGA